MSEDEQKKMRIENLIFKLNNLGVQRKEHMDQLWIIETQAEKLRLELIKLIDGGLHDV